jgi:uncharacterized protein (TIGR00369 family)
MTAWVDLVRRARAANDPGLLCQHVPYARFAGINVEPEGNGFRCRLAYSDSIVGNPTIPALHGGVIGALLETTAILLLLWDSEPGIIPKTVNMSFDFLRSGRAVDTFAAGRVTKQGRRVANVRVEAWQDDPARPIAAAHGHFLLVREDDNG